MARSRAVTTDAVGAVAVLSVLAVTALWTSNRGIQDLAGPSGGASSLGRLTGLLSADLLLIQVLLMARLPWVERGFGRDRLARWHRIAGFISVNLMLAHVLLVTLGYAGSVSRFGNELWSLLVDAPGILLAFASMLLLVLVAVTSIRAARRRLRYESWHLLHLYAYLGIGLAIPHQLWIGTDLTTSGVATAYWWTLYLAAAASIIVFRIGVPLARSAYHRLEVAEVVGEAPGVVSVHLRGHRLDRLPVRAGQFFLWRFLDGPGWSRAHPYSLSAAPRGDRLRITVKDLGAGSARVASLRPGTRALIEGPFGRLTGEAYGGGRVTMFGCGVGITPLRSLLEELPYAAGQATLVYRIRSDADIVFRDELRELASDRGIRVIYVPGPRAGDHSWLPSGEPRRDDVAAIQELVPDLRDHDLYICGPDSWAEAVRTAAITVGVPPSRIHAERFAW
ncbi:MAG: ferredoxin reductase family protein [Dactylosporangium sp.]|nr:ferredoxin reductase family protein [Dactylosporangium sp.]NNJ60265.1 ferredoxin reductase family protein [Dactylosporangium sp.]